MEFFQETFWKYLITQKNRLPFITHYHKYVFQFSFIDTSCHKNQLNNTKFNQFLFECRL